VDSKRAGLNNPTALSDMVGLATSLCDFGNPKSAADLLQHAIEGHRTGLGDAHPSILLARVALAWAFTTPGGSTLRRGCG